MEFQEPVAGSSRACTRSMARKQLKLQSNHESQKEKEEKIDQPEKYNLPQESVLEKDTMLVKVKGQMFQGTLMPFAIMTEDVWSLVLKRLTTLDRLSLCRTNSQLDTAFGANKYEWLLDQVLPYLLKNLSVSGLKMPLLRMRQVCKSWRNTIDAFLECDLPNRRPYQKDHPLGQVLCRHPARSRQILLMGLSYIELNPGNLSRKFLTFPTCTKKIVSKAIRVRIEDRWSALQVQQFTTELLSFLKAHGVKLWHFEINVDNEALPLPVFYPLLVNYLQEMSNLRTLSVWHFAILSRFSINNVVRPLIKGSPLPDLPRLSCMYVSLPITLNSHFEDEYGPQLKRLSTVQLGGYKAAVTNSVVNVLDLHFSVMGNLTYCQLHLPQLQRLTLDSTTTSLNAGNLNSILRRLPNLTSFKLGLPVSLVKCVVAKRQGKDFREIPSVEIFELETRSWHIFGFCPLLLAFPNLKYVHITKSRGGAGGSGTGTQERINVDSRVEIESYLEENRMEESPIWNTFGNLKVFSFKDEDRRLKRVCTREQVNRYKAKKYKSN